MFTSSIPNTYRFSYFKQCASALKPYHEKK
nr:MAG TPA: hypothetical protein [Caudoviricetes sp.]